MCIRSAHFNALSPIIHHELAHYNALMTGLIMAKELPLLFADGAWQDAHSLKIENPLNP
ncbi:hypothetical protein SAMN04490202_0824 [Pseudomonas reinekei]|uniref:Uncharacterized protein n=2 Tax=Pseudomonas reinekei TaxID=395598 RepID=A0A1H0JDR3_PSERE|nr:hypothetical protein SAMN04490202_0824 [Pseudomonas reinekei]